MEKSTKRKSVEKYILDSIARIDDTASGLNIKRYKEMFNSMTDAQFDTYMNHVKNKRTSIHVYLPNMSKRPSLAMINKIAKDLDVKIFHKIKMFDNITNCYFITPNEYPVLRLPIRRLQQFLDKKMSVPKGDSKIDALTGQVAWDDKSATLTNPEIQVLNSKGLNNVLHEFIAVRGGNIQAWSGEMKQQAEETGVVRLADLSAGSVTRTAMVTEKFIESMMLSINIIGGNNG